MTYRGFFENASEGFFQSTPEGRFLMVNPALVKMLGYDNVQEVLALDIARHLWVDSAAREEYKRIMEREGRVSKFEIALKKRDGSTIIVRESARAIKDQSGRVICHEGILEDVTDQKRAEEELRQRHRELMTLYAIAQGMNRDPSVKSILHNTLFELTRVLNVPFGCVYLRGDDVLELRSYQGVGADPLILPSRLALAEHPWLENMTVVHRPQGARNNVVWAQVPGVHTWVSMPLYSKNDLIGVLQLASVEPDCFTSANISLIVAVTNQLVIMLENARLYDQIKESERKYRSIFNNVSVGLYQTTPDGRILTANPALVRLLGYESVEELLAADVRQDIYVDPADREKALQVLQQQGQYDSVELHLRRKDGRQITVLDTARTVRDAHGNVLYFEGMLMDITEKKVLEQQLLQAQKMESIGTLTGGIAHEFNNLLTGILGYASLLLQQTDPQDRAYSQLQVIQQSARRGAQLTEQMLTFSRQSVAQFQPTDMNDVVRDMLTLIRPMMDASIEIHLQLHANPSLVRADAGQLQQVLVALCVNARDAMPAGGSITIETFTAHMGEAEARAHADAYPGQFVVTRISDTGIGIAPEHLPRIFDPFFTTKEVHQGTGLGLSVAYGIIKSHNGFIVVQSQVGEGTQFSIYLPLLQQDVRESMAKPEDQVAQRAATILVVDDEPIVRDLAKAILERERFRVLTADSGAEALTIYQQHHPDVDLVLLDLTMPKMSGRACLQQLRQLNPDVRVLLSSGYSGDERLQDLLTVPTVGFIRKPYLAVDLADAVRRMLAKS
ncbi:MAG: PAS domain S-box protein [Blastocatellia bacterium]|nr:PAS domain S-box protein [Blastocatellia bacterium]